MTKKMALCLFIVFAFASRFLNWPPNFSPLLAVGIFSGMTLSLTGFGILLPLSLMIASDIFLGFHETMASNYIAVILICLMSQSFKKSSKAQRFVLAPFLASVVFFLVSNTGVWWLSDLYPRTSQGLIHCLTMGLPFFPNTLASTILFNFVFLAAWSVIERRWSFHSPAQAKEF